MSSAFECVQILPSRVSSTYLSPTSQTVYNQLLIKDKYFCTCWQGLQGKWCKHLQMLVGYIECQGLIIPAEDEQTMVRMIQTSLDNYNKLMGGLSIGSVNSLYGAPRNYKTQIMVQFSFDIMCHYMKEALKSKKPNEKCNVLYLDTENKRLAEDMLLGEDETGKTWIGKYNERFGMNVGLAFYRIDMDTWQAKPGKFLPLKLIFEHNPEAPNKFIVLDVGTIDECMLAHGRSITIDYGRVEKATKKKDQETVTFDSEGKGKITVKPDPSWKEFRRIEQTPIAQWVQQFKIAAIIYDSITSITAADFTNDTPALPGRASANSILYDQIWALANRYDLVIMTSHHLTRAPNIQYAKGTPTGGQAVEYNTSYSVYMKRGTGSEEDDDDPKLKVKTLICNIECQRHPNRKPGSMVAVKMTNDGLVDN